MQQSMNCLFMIFDGCGLVLSRQQPASPPTGPGPGRAGRGLGLRPGPALSFGVGGPGPALGVEGEGHDAGQLRRRQTHLQAPPPRARHAHVAAVLQLILFLHVHLHLQRCDSRLVGANRLPCRGDGRGGLERRAPVLSLLSQDRFGHFRVLPLARGSGHDCLLVLYRLFRGPGLLRAALTPEHALLHFLGLSAARAVFYFAGAAEFSLSVHLFLGLSRFDFSAFPRYWRFGFLSATSFGECDLCAVEALAALYVDVIVSFGPRFSVGFFYGFDRRNLVVHVCEGRLWGFCDGCLYGVSLNQFYVVLYGVFVHSVLEIVDGVDEGGFLLLWFLSDVGVGGAGL